MQSFLGCAWLSLSCAFATSFTQTSGYTMTPMNGFHSCSNIGTTTSVCPVLDASGFASANASATAGDRFVSVALTGGASLYGAAASATSRAASTQQYVFSNGTGTGSVTYTVALSGYSNGNPREPASVSFNGSNYPILPNALPTYYSFTQIFLYGQPFDVGLCLDMTSNWNGGTGDSGTRFARAELTSLGLFSRSALSVPEPTTAAMCIGGALLILVGLRRNRRQR